MNKTAEAIFNETSRVITGKADVIIRILTAIIADGHILLDDVPGVGKTTLAVALSRAIDFEYRRIQFTPDVMPSDIVGYSVYNHQNGSLTYRPGIATGANLLLADEINRTSGKTQSALLETMEERQMTVDGVSHPLMRPFIVIATQNRVGTAGTQSMPYAQTDRFMMRLSLGYPDAEALAGLLRDRQTSDPMESVRRVASRDDIIAMQDGARRVKASDAVLDYISRLTLASQKDSLIETGISPRSALMLMKAAKARAYIDDRDYVSPADVKSLFADVCAHRLIPSAAARAQGLNCFALTDRLLKSVSVPDRKL